MMWMFVLLSVLAAVLLHWLLIGSYSYWRKRGVPNPPTIPIIGNIGASLVLKKSLGQIYADIYNTYKDYLYVGFYKIQKPSIIIRDVELIKTIVIKEFSSFHDNDFEVNDTIDPIFARNPFVLKGQKWKVIRSKVTTGITTGRDARGKDGLDAKELAAKFTTDVVASCSFGLEGNTFTDPNSEFRKMGNKLFGTDFLSVLKMVIVFGFPKLSTFLKLKIFPSEVHDWFMGMLSETIKYREENNVVKNDYLDLMLSLKNKPGENEFTDIDVMAQCMTFFIDGFETSSVALSFAFYELAKNPDVQAKLQTEVDTVLKNHGGEISYDAIQEMTYLNNVVSETLRKHPPALFLSRECTKPFTLPPPKDVGTGKEVLIEEGVALFIPVYAIHYDPKYYPDPNKFDPDRFTDEAVKSRPKCTYMPFGEGPRMCLGFRFALIQIKAAIAAVAANFDIKVNPKTTPTFEVDPRYFLMGKKGGIWLDFYKRNV